MAIQFYNNKILFDSHKIAFDENCCCGEVSGCNCIEVEFLNIEECSMMSGVSWAYEITETGFSGKSNKDRCGDYTDGEISSQVYVDVVNISGNYYIDVTLGKHKWRKNYYTVEPDLCSLTGELIPFYHNTGICSTGSSDVKLKTLESGCSVNPDISLCQTACCYAESTDSISVTIPSGLWSNGSCDSCVDISGTFISDYEGLVVGGVTGCNWKYVDDEWCNVSYTCDVYLSIGTSITVNTDDTCTFDVDTNIILSVDSSGCGFSQGYPQNDYFYAYYTGTFTRCEDCWPRTLSLDRWGYDSTYYLYLCNVSNPVSQTITIDLA